MKLSDVDPELFRYADVSARSASDVSAQTFRTTDVSAHRRFGPCQATMMITKRLGSGGTSGLPGGVYVTKSQLTTTDALKIVAITPVTKQS